MKEEKAAQRDAVSCPRPHSLTLTGNEDRCSPRVMGSEMGISLSPSASGWEPGGTVGLGEAG